MPKSVVLRRKEARSICVESWPLLRPRRVTEILELSQCPLCGRPNGCQLCSDGADKERCWCFDVVIPPELVSQIPEVHRNQVCICHDCVTNFRREHAPQRPAAKLSPGDFYFENNVIVFTAQYHMKRGFCCGSGCRHCPYGGAGSQLR